MTDAEKGRLLEAALRDIAAALPRMDHTPGCAWNWRNPPSWNDCQCWQNSIRSRIPHHLRGNL